eukprot:gene32438-37378_t
MRALRARRICAGIPSRWPCYPVGGHSAPVVGGGRLSGRKWSKLDPTPCTFPNHPSVPADAANAPSRRTAVMRTGHISGRIQYLAGDGRETGRERFELIGSPAGVTLRAFCEMDDVALTRDVTLAMDAQWRPLDGFCRISRHGAREAALWFDVGAHDVRLNGWIGGARAEQASLALAGPLVYLGLHPLQGDALIVNARGIEQPGVFVPIACATNSISPDGDE